MSMKRRDFLKLSGAGLAGLAMGGLDFPLFTPKRAYASGVQACPPLRVRHNAEFPDVAGGRAGLLRCFDHQKFTVGPWRQGHELGAYGVDPSTKTAWAVLNYGGDFVVARNIENVPGL